MKRKIVGKIVFAIFLLAVFFMGVCEAISEDISTDIVRLHIIANSNSQNDQSIKLKVRDAIIKKAQESDEEITIEYVNKNKAQIEKRANDVLLKNGCDYICRVETGRFYFPTKFYENITLPEGDYDAVRIILGNGNGENWWCVMYPPLCFTDKAKGEMSTKNKEKLKSTMSDASYELISEESIIIKPAFRALELWQNLSKRWGI